MTVHTSIFTELFALWPHDGQERFRDIDIAQDMGVTRRCVRQWIARGYVPPWYWDELIDVVDQRFDRVVTYRQLAQATRAIRGPAAKRSDAGRAEAA